MSFFIAGCLCRVRNALTIKPNSLVGWKGSCILIPCQISKTYQTRNLNNISLMWYFGTSYNDTVKDYTGTILYNSSETPPKRRTTTLTSLQKRVIFAGDLNERNCDLKISQLQGGDHGSYGARLYGIVEGGTEINKWFHNSSVNIFGKNLSDMPLFVCIFSYCPVYVSRDT